MNVNEQILDKITADTINIQRYEATVQRQVIQQLRDLEAKVVAELKASNAITAVRKQTQDKRLTALLKKTRNTIATAYKDISKAQILILAEVAELSEIQTVNALNQSLKANVIKSTMSKSMLNAIASKTLIEGSPTKEWWARKGAGFQAKFEDTIRMGMLQGDTTDNIVRGLIGTRVNKFKDAALQAQRRGAEAVVRSSIQTVANTARLDTFANNSDVIKGIEWVATLDNRTSVICMELDGLEWDLEYNPIGHSKPFPSAIAHWNCRSTQVPVTKSWEELGAKGKFSEIPESTRSSMDGQVAGDMNYQQWLGTKSKAFQQEVLGVQKQKLWKAGKISFSDLVNQRGHPLTLEQLQNKIKPIPQPKPKLLTTKDIQTALSIELVKNGKDARYVLKEDGKPQTRFRSDSKKLSSMQSIGSADFSGLTNEASILFEKHIQIGERWMKKLGVQGLRGVIPNTSSRRVTATMGDGVFTFKKKWFNLGADNRSIFELEKLADLSKNKTAILKKELEIEKVNFVRVRTKWEKNKGSTQEIINYKIAHKSYTAIIKKYNNSLKSKAKEDLNYYINSNKLNTWQVGDDLKLRPWTADSYFKGNAESLKTTVIHEYGHQIHQQFAVRSINQYKNPPLEEVLSAMFRKKGTIKPTGYSDKNFKEWFAESFSLYAQGRLNLIDPRLVDLLQKMEKGIITDAETLFKWQRSL